MAGIDLAVSDYRCVGGEPARFTIQDGFTALVGTNNSGKSTLLRMLYELRPVLADAAHQLSEFRQNQGYSDQYLIEPQIADGERIFHVGGGRPVYLSISSDAIRALCGQFGYHAGRLVITYSTDRRVKLALQADGDLSSDYEESNSPGPDLREVQGKSLAFDAAVAALIDTQYIGPFRGVRSAEGNYFDLVVGAQFEEQFVEFKAGHDHTKNDLVAGALEELRRIFRYRSLDINVSPKGGLQLDFLSLLGKYAQNGVVFATHSLGLARTAADRIYTLTKLPSGTSRVREYDSEPELVTLLGQLSFDKTPELGFDRVVLVEGKTELRAMAQLLRLYGKEHQIMLLPLHGGEMIRGDVERELSELKRLTGNLQYLIDSEREEKDAPLSRNRQAFVDLCDSLGITGHVLERRALENYFPQQALTRAFGGRASELGPYDKKGDKNDWPKTGNWKSAAHLSLGDLSGTDLGQFLERA